MLFRGQDTRITSFETPSQRRRVQNMSLPVKFDHCVVHVTDWERSNQFYREVVGAEIIDRNGRFVYRFGETPLNLHGPGVKADPSPGCRYLPEAPTSALPGTVR